MADSNLGAAIAGDAPAPDVQIPTSNLSKMLDSIVGNYQPPQPRMATPKEYLQDPKVMAAVQYLYNKAAMSFYDKTNASEHMYALDKNGDVSVQSVTDPWKKRNAVASVPQDSQLIMHSHPVSGQVVPSPGDYVAATKLGKPNFVISRNAIYVAMPGMDPNTNKHIHVADIRPAKGGKLSIDWK